MGSLYTKDSTTANHSSKIRINHYFINFQPNFNSPPTCLQKEFIFYIPFHSIQSIKTNSHLYLQKSTPLGRKDPLNVSVQDAIIIQYPNVTSGHAQFRDKFQTQGKLLIMQIDEELIL